MDLKLWLKESCSKNTTPGWSCPTCEKGFLNIHKDQFHFKETQLSKSWHSHDDWEPEYTQYRFHGTLVCNNCDDFVAFLGIGRVTQDYYDGGMNYKEVFFPKTFYPALKIFKIHETCPEDIRNEIEDSFGLFWNDLKSCANKIRISLELLMNFQKVKKTKTVGGKRKSLSLHERIEEFRSSNPIIADYLLAIKWIGNVGSHVGELEKIDILETYELLEHSLNELFEGKEKKLKKISKEINKRKGKRKR